MVKVLIRESYGNEDTSERLYVRNDEQSLTVIDGQNNQWFTLSTIKMFFTVSLHLIYG